MLDLTTKFSRNATFTDTALDRAAVIMNAEAHLYFAANRVGARIWALLETPRTLPELVGILVGEFAVDESVCRGETEAFLRQLIARHLIAPA